MSRRDTNYLSRRVQVGKPIVTCVGKDEGITLNNKDYMVLTRGQVPESQMGGGGGIQEGRRPV